MAAFIKENTQFVDIDGKPIVNGKLYIGINGSDPVANPLAIFSDRALTVALANPQTLNSFGESTNKIWIGGKYSIQVNNSNAVQKFQDLDAGETAESGVTTLSNVQGTNTITAGASTTITNYTDKEIYVFTINATNSGAATLNIDNVSADPIVGHNGSAIPANTLIANSVVIVVRNNTNSNFELIKNIFSTQAQAQAGTDENTSMTPLRVQEAIDNITISTVQIFTGDGTYTKPSGLRSAIVELVAGGGGGGGSDNTGSGEYSSGGGGGGGGYARELLVASVIGATETVTIGAGGAANSAANGGTGGTSSFGSLLSATGGVGGINSTASSSPNAGGGGAGGVGTGGDINSTGGGGASSGNMVAPSGASTIRASGGSGGSSYFGGGAKGTTGNSDAQGNTGQVYGGGGSGAGAAGSAGTANAGGAGGSGFLIVTEFY